MFEEIFNFLGDINSIFLANTTTCNILAKITKREKPILFHISFLYFIVISELGHSAACCTPCLHHIIQDIL